MKKLLIILLVIFGLGHSEVKVETDPNFNLSLYKNIYLYITTFSKDNDNLISGISVRKSKEKVLSMFKGLGYNPIEISSFANAPSGVPIVEIKMYEGYLQYKTGGYSYNTYNYVPGQSYSVNTYSYATGSYSYGTVHTSGHIDTQTNYVPERTNTAKYNYGHIRIYNSKGEEVFLAYNSFTDNYNYVDVAENLFLDIFTYIPASNYFKPTLKYFGKDKDIYTYNNYIPGYEILKATETINLGNNNFIKKGDVVYLLKSKEVGDHLTDILTSLVIFYPLMKGPDDIQIMDKRGNSIWLNKNKFKSYAELYTLQTEKLSYTDALSYVR
jgi:hypothetical protein